MAIKTTLNYSPNFDLKKRGPKDIEFIILHYTGMKIESDAIRKLTNIKSKVSCHYLIKNKIKNKSTAFEKSKEGSLYSELSYEFVKSLKNYHLIKVLPKTGRHHQIRVQLAKIGSPIKGDLKYGAKRSNKDASICLHAREIEFIHPIKNEIIIIKAKPPRNVLWNECV